MHCENREGRWCKREIKTLWRKRFIFSVCVSTITVIAEQQYALNGELCYDAEESSPDNVDIPQNKGSRNKCIRRARAEWSHAVLQYEPVITDIIRSFDSQCLFQENSLKYGDSFFHAYLGRTSYMTNTRKYRNTRTLINSKLLGRDRYPDVYENVKGRVILSD